MSIPLAYEAAVEHATAALKQEGFGVLMSIDVRQTLKQKLDIDFRKYVILGACNPPLAHRALLAELDIGLLLPCNVIVYESGPTQSVVAVMAPMSMIAIVGENPALAAVAREADERLRRVVERRQATASSSASTLASVGNCTSESMDSWAFGSDDER